MPSPIGGYAEPQFDLVEFFVVLGLLAVPMLLCVIGMTVVSSRNYKRTSPRSLAVDALLPPTAIAVIYVSNLTVKSGFQQGIAYLLSKDRLLLEYPVGLALYATSAFAVIIYCRLLPTPPLVSAEARNFE